MASSFQVDGLISGLNTADIIQQLLAVERQPITALEAKKATLQQRSDAMREVNTRLSALRDAVTKLTLQATMNAKTATTDTPSTAAQILAATAGADAALGSFKVTVDRLATATVATSTSSLASPIDETATLDNAGFAITPTTGYFTIDGVQIAVDVGDKLNDPTDPAHSIVAKINNAGIGVTASVVNNRLTLTSNSTMQLGSGGDTSNFLTAAKLIAAPQTGTGPYVIESTGNLGVTKVTSYLADARLSTALNATGSFKINGRQFDYDASVDTLNGVISRINASDAGVIAAYDGVTDRLILTAKSTGSTSIALEDVSGDFLAAMKVAGSGAQTVGQSAKYAIDTINGGGWLYSSSNTVTGVVPGVTLNLKNTSATPVTVTVGQDTATTVAAVKDFIDKFNSTMDFIREKTAYNSTTKTAGTLMGDSTVLGIESRLRQLVCSSVYGLAGGITSLASVGISTGAIGSAVGSTDSLTLNETKFTEALINNPTAVAQLFGSLAGTLQLQAGGTGSIAGVSGCPNNAVESGTYTITSDGAGNLSAVFTPQGGTAGAAVTGTISAGGTNTTLIPGVTLTAKASLVSGTDTLQLTLNGGVASRLLVHLTSMTMTGGLLDDSKEASDKEIEQLNRQIAAMEDRLTAKQETLQKKFAALEVAMAKLQQQSGSLSAQLAHLNSQNG